MGNDALCGLRTQRRLWGLNQQELATLLGVRGRDQVSRLERGERIPPYKVGLACELLFNVPAIEIFPTLWDEAEEVLMAKVHAMYERLLPETKATAVRKRELMEACLSRGVISIKRKQL